MPDATTRRRAARAGVEISEQAALAPAQPAAPAAALAALPPCSCRTPDWLTPDGFSVKFGLASYLLSNCLLLCCGGETAWGGDPAARATFRAVGHTPELLVAAAFAAIFLVSALDVCVPGSEPRERYASLTAYVTLLGLVCALLLIHVPDGRMPVFGTLWGTYQLPLKYVTWMHSSPALIALVALAGDAPLAEYHAAVARSAGIFVLGFAGMYVRSPVPTFALLSVALGCTVVAALWRWFGSAIEATVKGEPARRALRVCRVWSVLTWLAFPLVFASELLPGPRLRRPGPRQLAFAYAVVDFATKALWASSVAAAALQALEARREAAAAARTATSRAAVTDMRRALAAIRAGLGL